NLSQNADQYVWDFGDGTTSTEEDPEHYYQEPGWYTVRLLTDNEFGCPDSFVIDEAVFADNKGSIEFPTAFIPDPSGPNGGSYDPNSFRNDIFFPVFEGVIEYHLMIFNRWGEIIFETKEIGRGWDGYHQLTGQILQQDVYVWRANVTFANQQTQELAGEVTLLR
ncbi:MAG TPA: pkd domain containing protein, partial [Flavobacteriales bacterium]|nr:pkd domain containing protein [Flavobacteriales bacterium]